MRKAGGRGGFTGKASSVVGAAVSLSAGGVCKNFFATGFASVGSAHRDLGGFGWLSSDPVES